MKCWSCNNEAKVLVNGLCPKCYKPKPPTVEEWMNKLSNQLDGIEKMIKDYITEMKGGKP